MKLYAPYVAAAEAADVADLAMPGAFHFDQTTELDNLIINVVMGRLFPMHKCFTCLEKRTWGNNLNL
jgi:hypothetical protein